MLIAGFTGWTDYRQWDKFAGQQSANITLLAGHRYYIEVLHKANSGNNNVSVAWTLPGGAIEIPIAGAHLIPFTVPTPPKVNFQPTQRSVSATAASEPQLLVYPNPLTSQTTVEFSLPAAGEATVSVYDATNHLVRRLFSGPATAGPQPALTLAGSGLAPGWYMVQLLTATKIMTQKLLKTD